MATQEEKLAAAVGETSSLKVEIQDYVEDYEDAMKCGCCFRWRRSGLLGQQQDGEIGRENWLVKKVKKVKEISEVIAGPRWKTFIRRVSLMMNKKRKSSTTQQFHYDSQNYKLNFDDGDVSDGAPRLDFSARFAAPMNKDRVGS